MSDIEITTGELRISRVLYPNEIEPFCYPAAESRSRPTNTFDNLTMASCPPDSQNSSLNPPSLSQVPRASRGRASNLRNPPTSLSPLPPSSLPDQSSSNAASTPGGGAHQCRWVDTRECEGVFATAEERRHHFVEAHQPYRRREYDTKWTCRWSSCTSKFDSHEHFLEHLAFHHLDQFHHVCTICRPHKLFLRATFLAKHHSHEHASGLQPLPAQTTLPQSNSSKPLAIPSETYTGMPSQAGPLLTATTPRTFPFITSRGFYSPR